jgi:hypothetical protein
LAAARDLDDIIESALETPDEGVEGVTQLLFRASRMNFLETGIAASSPAGRRANANLLKSGASSTGRCNTI